jgi:hypothetical protein
MRRHRRHRRIISLGPFSTDVLSSSVDDTCSDFIAGVLRSRGIEQLMDLQIRPIEIEYLVHHGPALFVTKRVLQHF